MTGLQPFDPGALLAIALLNPAVVIVALLMGRAADEPQKILIAGFAAAVAGTVLVWLGAYFKVLPARGNGGEAGLFVMMLVIGIGWAALGYWLTRSRRKM